jgi:hypothetical protein
MSVYQPATPSQDFRLQPGGSHLVRLSRLPVSRCSAVKLQDRSVGDPPPTAWPLCSTKPSATCCTNRLATLSSAGQAVVQPTSRATSTIAEVIRAISSPEQI